MKSVPFTGSNIEIGKGQPEYNVIHAMAVPGPEREVICCFELTDEELKQINQTKKIYYSRWTFGQPFQPMRLFTDLSDGIEFIPEVSICAKNCGKTEPSQLENGLWICLNCGSSIVK